MPNVTITRVIITTYINSRPALYFPIPNNRPAAVSNLHRLPPSIADGGRIASRVGRAYHSRLRIAVGGPPARESPSNPHQTHMSISRNHNAMMHRTSARIDAPSSPTSAYVPPHTPASDRGAGFQPACGTGFQPVSAVETAGAQSPAAWSKRQTLGEIIAKVAILVIAAGLLVPLAAKSAAWFGFSIGGASAVGRILWMTTMVYGAVMYAAFAWRVWLWRRYKPIATVSDDRLPYTSVIIPAFNEGPLVRQSILSAAASLYPRDKFEIIAIDDGSDDDTWEHILAAAESVAGQVRVTTLRQPRNMGKRHALYRGFTHARGDVFVTMDSDSIFEPDALRNAVSPLVAEPEVGCVAGCVQVLNPRDSVFTRFLKTTFSLSFKFVRAYQHEFRGVFCTPGALSVYRAEVVRRVADEWLNQTFLGLPCNTGEDRAMTNLFLKEGWLTAYQQNAVVWAKMPHTYRGLTNMFLRWARSNLRETWFLFKFLFTPFRKQGLQAFRLNIILATLALVLPPFMIAGGIGLMLTHDGYIWRHLAVMLFWSTTSAAIYRRNERDSDWIYLFAYQFFWVSCLSWIIPYAAVTLRDNTWLTRRSRNATDAGATEAPAAMDLFHVEQPIAAQANSR